MMVNPNNNKQKTVYKEKGTITEITNIATINIRGINGEFKKQQLKDFVNREHIQIMGLSDTKLKENSWKKTLCCNKYKTIWGYTNKQAGGVGIMVE
jgi:exonuclease III